MHFLAKLEQYQLIGHTGITLQQRAKSVSTVIRPPLKMCAMLRFMLLISSLLLASQCHAAALRACISEVDLPPFAFRSGNTTKGFSIDVLQQLLRDTQHQLAVLDRLPWRRCISQLQQGNYHLALNARAGQFDDAELLASKPLYPLHYMYFYSRQRFPQGLRLRSLAELPHYRLCSLTGQGYEAFGIEAQQVDSGTSSYTALIGKLHNRRCELFIEAREVIAGHLLLDPQLASQLQDPKLDEAPLPGDNTETALLLLISPQAQRSIGLHGRLNQGIETLQNNGTLARLMMKYLR